MNKNSLICFFGWYASILVVLALGWQIFIQLSFASWPALTMTGPAIEKQEKIATEERTIILPQLSLNSIFKTNHFWQELPQEKVITLITTGDVIPARTVNYKMTLYDDFTHPFLKTGEFLKAADLVLINLEAPLLKNCPVSNSGMIFCGNQRFIDGLLFSGIDLVNLANNHSLNWGIDGIGQTIELLNQYDISTFGFPVNQLAIKEIKGTKLGFLGWNFLEEFNQEEVLNIVKQVKAEVDLLLVSVHWGAEYSSYPAEWQKELAHQLIEAGADMIVGNHPHWIQPLELYQGKLIIYAHGNFIFDQEWSQETKTGVIGEHVFYQNKLINSRFLPVFISDYNQPEFLTGERKEQVLNHLKMISEKIAVEESVE